MGRHSMAEHTRYERLYGLFLAYAALLALFGLVCLKFGRRSGYADGFDPAPEQREQQQKRNDHSHGFPLASFPKD